MYQNVELRKLPADAQCKVVNILEKDKYWKKVMSVIPKDLRSEDFEPKYNNEQIGMIEDHAILYDKKCTAILMDEWGTSGRYRPTLNTLKDILTKAQIFSAADEIAIMLNESVPVRTRDKRTAVKSNKYQKYNGSTRQKVISYNNTYSNEIQPGEIKPASDFIGSTKETQIQKPMNMQYASYMLRKSNSDSNLQSATFTNESKDSESFQLNNPNIYQHSPKPYYQTSFPNINISTGIESIVLPNTKLAHSGYDKSTAVKSNDNQKYNESSRQTEFASDNKTCSSEMLPVQIKTARDPTDLAKEQQTQESRNTRDSSYMPRKNNSASLQSTTSTNESKDSHLTSSSNINIPTGIESTVLKNINLDHFDYEYLYRITGEFSNSLINDPNHGPKGRIGCGGFGDVFVGKDSIYGMVAVKKAHNHLAIQRRPNIVMSLFNTEVKYLSQFRHNNIVPILGFSMNGPTPCIVCEYIDGGSLQQNIAAKILNELQRMNIIIGTAEGLKYLHTSDKQCKEGSSILNIVGKSDSQNSIKYFVHGDIKTANILLTRNFVPKLCDFGLAKQYDSTFVTTCPMGTSAYMAPEGMHGTVTQKIDIYSFGIVILELLTGLKPIVENDGENINIKHYVEENVINNDITTLLDPVVKIWIKADEVYKLAKMCLEYDRKSRPTILEVCDILNRIDHYSKVR